MKDFQKLLKVVEESKEKREVELRNYITSHDTYNQTDYFQLGRLQGRIDEKKEIADAIKRIIKRKEQEELQKVQQSQTLKEIEEIEDMLKVIHLLGLLEILETLESGE